MSVTQNEIPKCMISFSAPQEVKSWLKNKADKEYRSISSHILSIIEREMQREVVKND